MRRWPLHRQGHATAYRSARPRGWKGRPAGEIEDRAQPVRLRMSLLEMVSDLARSDQRQHVDFSGREHVRHHRAQRVDRVDHACRKCIAKRLEQRLEVVKTVASPALSGRATHRHRTPISSTDSSARLLSAGSCAVRKGRRLARCVGRYRANAPRRRQKVQAVFRRCTGQSDSGCPQ